MSNSKHYIWSAVGKFGTEILGFVGNVLIARALSPDDYGLIATLSIITALAMSFTDGGFNDYLIRKRNSDKYDFGTVATYNMVVSSSIYVALFVFAPKIAVFFHREELVGVARVLGLSLIFKAFTLSGFVQLSKNLKFKQSSIIGLLCSLFSIIIVYAMALGGWGYWALALQPLVIALLNIMLLMIIAKWKPYFCFKWQRFKEMFGYSTNLLVSYIITKVGDNIYSVIIGRFYGTMDLGYYNQAHKMQTVPTNAINSIVMTTSYPLISKEGDSNKQKKMYVNIFQQYIFIMSLIVFLLIGLSDVTFFLLLGEKWLPSSPLFKIFILIGLCFPMKTINANIIKIQGRANVYRNLAFLRAGLQIVALCLCAPISLKAIVIGQVIAAFVSVSVDMFFCGRTINFGILKQYGVWISIIWKPVLAWGIATGVSLLINNLFMASACWLVTFTIIVFLICKITHDSMLELYLEKVKHIIIKKQL